jgi:23S rRNA (guanosine2251-2'-O)-methyltransferase
MGRHAVEATLRYQPERAIELWHGPSPELDEIIALAKGLGLPCRLTDVDTIDALAGGREQGSAQGVVLSCGPFPYVSVEDFETAPVVTLALDGVEDPRNFGAAVRAAYAMGAGLVLVPADRAASATASAIKTSAGALCRVPVARATNFRRALEILQEKGAWIVGAEADGDKAPWEIDATGQLVLVIGGEDRGLRRLTREACDFVTAIPMAATDMSLNAADAATLLLYEALRQRKTAGTAAAAPKKAAKAAPKKAAAKGSTKQA